MAEYIERDDFLKRIKPYNTSDEMDKALYNFALNKMIQTPTADVIERSEYEFLKQLNKELAIKYDNAMDIAINANEQSEKLHSKIKRAIEGMNNIDLNEYADNSYQLVNKCIEILKRNIGE